MTANRFLPAAQIAAQVIPTILQERGLAPVIDRYLLVETEGGLAWLFAVLNVAQMNKMEAYTAQDTIHHLSTALRGRPIIVSNSNGLRYAVLLTERPHLPQSIQYPGWRKGLVQLGVGFGGMEVTAQWKDLGHVLVGGMTGSGKSTFLRLLVAQAIQEGFQLALADPDGRSFPQLSGSPSLMSTLGLTTEGCVEVVQKALGEINRRGQLFNAAPGYPDSLEVYNQIPGIEPLPRILVIIDEFNGLVMATGGARALFAQAVTQLAWRGRKYGISLILAGQDFTKEIVGPVRDQMTTRVCFRVANPSTSRVILGQSGAEKFKTPGRALSNRWQVFQSYQAELETIPNSDGLSSEERKLGEILVAKYGGKMTFDVLGQEGYPRRQAERIRKDWLSRGLAVVRPEADNALFVNETRLLRINV